MEFRGWGCHGYDIKGRKIKNFELSNWMEIEKMIRSAYEKKELVSLEIFECWSEFQERRPGELTSKIEEAKQ